jgi:hypothetical protein
MPSSVPTMNRRAVLDGLARILDSAGPEELFAVPDEEVSFLDELLLETARGSAGRYRGEVRRAARRRGVTPAYVTDRAAIVLAAIRERRRSDLYRILGVPPLSSGDAIHRRWLTVAGGQDAGDEAHRRRVAEAYETLRDPERRADYERFWLRAVGPFERLASLEQPPAAVREPGA